MPNYVEDFDKAKIVAKRMRSAILTGDLSLDEVKADLKGQMKNTTDGIPFYGDTFDNQHLMVDAIYKSLSSGRMMDGRVNPLVTKDVLGTIGGAQPVTIRTDIVPHLINMFVDRFPFFDTIEKVPANGLSHTWDLITDYDPTDASFVDDFTAATPGKSSYAQQATLIAISLAERGSTFRMRLAEQQSGMRYDGKDASQREVANGVLALAHLHQKASFQGEKATAGKTGLDEYGTYYPFGYDGFRGILGNPGNAFATYYPGGEVPIAIDQGVSTVQASIEAIGQAVTDAGGSLNDYTAWMNYRAYSKISAEAGNLLRINAGPSATSTAYGVSIDYLLMGNTEVGIKLVPGDSVGNYVPATGAYAGTAGCTDIDFINSNEVQMACLGPDAPFVIEIPMGVDGTLTSRFLVAFLASLIVMAPAKQAKLRIGL